jgi:AcrR family transcriptional regulator
MAERQRDAEATRRALLEAACLRFAHQGFAGASVRDVAGDAGVDQALVYRYFGSKAALHAEVQRFYADQLDELFRIGEEDLASHVVALLFESPAGQNVEPLLALLHGGEPAGGVSLASQLRDFVDTLASRAPEGTPDARLRAALVGALTIGIPVLRDLLGDRSLAGAGPGDVATLYATVTRSLLGPDG